mmetsp:Transcript_33301/g.78089  ORF Transcript_33301/g.78089 Transcript_33301/m.78089 type:complete len:301 (-) Transcript_33301:16-918(-)
MPLSRGAVFVHFHRQWPSERWGGTGYVCITGSWTLQPHAIVPRPPSRHACFPTPTTAPTHATPQHIVGLTTCGRAQWRPADGGLFVLDVCCHASFGPVREGQSTCSLVVHLPRSTTPSTARPSATLWYTGTSAPCLSIFKPLWLDALPDRLGGSASDEHRPRTTTDRPSRWWKGERLHRAVLVDYTSRAPLLQDERNALERRFLAQWQAVSGGTVAARQSMATESLDMADEAAERWTRSVHGLPVTRTPPPRYAAHWAAWNRHARLSVPGMSGRPWLLRLAGVATLVLALAVAWMMRRYR